MSTLGLNSADQKAIDTFRREAVEPSQTKLVLLYFTASWCNPCKTFGPLLEKVVKGYTAKGVTLIKFDIDQNKIIADQLRVQSVPTVYALFQGQLVADLTPARSESQIKQSLDQLLSQLPIEAGDNSQANVADLLAMGNNILDSGDAERACSIFGQIYDMEPDDPAVIGSYARALIMTGDVHKAESVLSNLPETVADKPEVHRALSALKLAQQAMSVDVDQLGALRAKVAAYPDDDEARFTLAGDLMAIDDRDGAADQLFAILEHDRNWNEGAARTKLLQLFEVVGIEDPWVSTQRRRLSAILFR
ncbi:MAG: tetratricopeptide repeat protein [Zymomonas mobilis subsp. pomaceae]|uniref:Thioredoxin domain protein n=1 Tax=Zymomonas mobilis subsp. pomaceae (strain ATCC 29192 / DSM 22645 / JCM 10191 / CCUG 17912 / NBRC 13757 / NCIMB 11200 / NRRL B-4491 / Barker I) TaxID=579138 RepID=F8EV83_ZYMMT|nr:tetratricopeptide repeat protein [Zymomonas mobilis]AEI38301.1 Thioredoxin domain protein [Zymomonas mobilis subsp. pomaceae ATCC 29192]MDX5947989.1 tetratricopeptide repeat protein [Zymomonas mobilis subsp. pomaceae]GEB89320.1 co-chaperone YbbN [Zymomonas mobilis subsp. pomaceae]